MVFYFIKGGTGRSGGAAPHIETYVPGGIHREEQSWAFHWPGARTVIRVDGSS